MLGDHMPTISMFYGTIIRMFFKGHIAAHFHASYQGHHASFDFDGNLAEGEMPTAQRKMIEAWTVLHKDELIANWELVREEGHLFGIDPLR